MTAGNSSSAESGVPGDIPAELDDEQVRNYLKQHSDFFEHHPDMLDHLHISHSSGTAVSLVEKQVSVLRDRNMEMRKRLNSLTENARDNDRIFEKTRSLVLGLLEANTPDQLGEAFNRSMSDDFGVEYASMILFGDPQLSSAQCRVDTAETARIEIGALLKSGKPVCGVLRKEELSYLFPKAGEIGSAAMMPLIGTTELGVIAVGSSDANHYNSSMGTLFLNHVGDVLIRLLPRLFQGTVQD
jgi:uncharacterized protein YigA (DUF484 family)